MAAEGKAYPVITISREYGAWGRTIARGLSEALGIPYYDRDFVRETARASGYDEEDIRREGEDLSRAGKLMNSILNNAASYNSTHDGIFRAQKEVILQLAKEPCILVGRCANVILHDAGVPCFRVFLYADAQHRLQRAGELGECPGGDLEKYVAKRNTSREVYYKTYTGHALGDCHDYDICLDAGSLGADRCVTLLAGLLS